MEHSKINILVYSPQEKAETQVIQSLKSYLGSKYAVQPVRYEQLANEPWEGKTALLVISGLDPDCTKDVPVRAINKIQDYVKTGGKYLGIGGGGYFGALHQSSQALGLLLVVVKAAFDLDDAHRNKATTIIFKENTSTNLCFKAYCSGGPRFEDLQGKDVDVLGTYADSHHPAIIGGRVEEGRAVLSGVHLEYNPSAFSDSREISIQTDLILDDSKRISAFVSLLKYLDLTLDEKPSSFVPHLSDIHLVVPDQIRYEELWSKLSTLSTPFSSTVPGKTHTLKFQSEELPEMKEMDRSEIVPVIVTKRSTHASADFDSDLFFKFLTTNSLGRILMCGHTITSTQTILMDHFLSLQDFYGLTFIAATQVSGRGRGNNVWVSPYGCLLASFQLAPQTFTSLLYIEYILAIAVVSIIRSHVGEDVDVNIKWPNDVYYNKTKKLGGILVSSNLAMDSSSLFYPIVGIGLNLWNTKPTTCVNEIIKEYNQQHGGHIAYFSKEEFLAKMLNVFEELIQTFSVEGFAGLHELYYKFWLHTNQEVTLESDGSVVTIQGLTQDGYLHAVSKDGKSYQLSPDQNSFDLMQGLIKKKI